jgi:hypothetical protein
MWTVVQGLPLPEVVLDSPPCYTQNVAGRLDLAFQAFIGRSRAHATIG